MFIDFLIASSHPPPPYFGEWHHLGSTLLSAQKDSKSWQLGCNLSQILYPIHDHALHLVFMSLVHFYLEHSSLTRFFPYVVDILGSLGRLS